MIKRFYDEEKRHEKKSNAKEHHVFSRNRLSFLFGTSSNAGATKSHMRKTILYLYDFVAKSCLVGTEK